MRILLAGFGSRGDVQPLIALGKGLRQAGYEVSLAAGINFQDWVTREGLDFEPIHVDVEALVNSETGREWLGNSSGRARAELQNMKRTADLVTDQLVEDLQRMIARADAFLSGLMTMSSLAAASEATGKPHVQAFLQPFTPTSSGTAALQALLPSQDIILNRWWGVAVQSLMWTVFRDATNRFREQVLKMPPTTRGAFVRSWNQTPSLIGVSPTVMPPPRDWPRHIHVTGYWFDAPADGWQPPAALAEFLAAGEAPVYIGFGSMSNADPAGTARILLDALRLSGRRGIVYRGWGGLHVGDVPDNVYLLDGAPHDWLFPRMAAVIHHGGAGTTAAGLRAGVPSMAVSHMGDQTYWGRRLHELGVGPQPLPRHELNAERLAERIAAMTTSDSMRSRAAALGQTIRAEDGVGNAVRVLERYL